MKQEFFKLGALFFEIHGMFIRAITYYQELEMHEKASEISTKVQLSNEERHKMYPTEEGIETWKKAIQEFSQHPAVIGFITRQERDELLKKIRTRVIDLLADTSTNRGLRDLLPEHPIVAHKQKDDDEISTDEVR